MTDLGPVLLNVIAVKSTAEAGVYICEIDITDSFGEPRQVEFGSRPDAAHGLGLAVRQWLDANPDFPRQPYAPPTAEQIREGMAPLSARQLRLGLVNGGFTLAQVSAVIDAMPAGPDKETARIEWEYATTFNRMHPLIATVGGALGLTDEQIDTMWTAAAAL